MDAVESTSPYSPPSLRHKLRTTVCGCFGSPSSPGNEGERPHSGGRTRWRRRVAAAGEFRYDPLSYALNFDDGSSGDSDGADGEDAAFRNRNFNSRLPPSPVPASRAVAIAIASRLKSFAASVALVSLTFLLLQVRLNQLCKSDIES
ncbi:uncharacterized protein LOC119333509 [Triticum dicoccoides]|uniref:uncharacterized protein LOC119333509 n=1 Tax=Triticum dicoccoides TaxID=85692 RepID=UPI001891C350|nr:uncharacterized protein LOC119333509 [Triticum dicoccoides]